MARATGVLALACAAALLIVALLLDKPESARARTHDSAHEDSDDAEHQEVMALVTPTGAPELAHKSRPLDIRTTLRHLSRRGTSVAKADEQGFLLGLRLLERPDYVEECRRCLRESASPRVIHALVVGLTWWASTGSDRQALLPEVLDAYDRTEDPFTRLAVVEGLWRLEAVDAMLRCTESLLISSADSGIGQRATHHLLTLAIQHPEREAEVARLWTKYLESETISIPEFCRVVEYLLAIDPSALRSLQPNERVANNALAKESMSRALRIIDAAR